MICYDKLLKRIDKEELERVVGVYITKSIIDGRSIRLKSVEKICKYLKCEPDDIISFK